MAEKKKKGLLIRIVRPEGEGSLVEDSYCRTMNGACWRIVREFHGTDGQSLELKAVLDHSVPINLKPTQLGPVRVLQ